MCGMLKDLTGKQFGSLKVIELSEIKNHKSYWRCKCSCGKIVEIRSQSLVEGRSKTCGCSYRPNLIGQKFGKLTVLKFIGNDKYNNRIWECICECGNITKVNSCSLRSNNTKSCGCLIKEVSSKIGLNNKKDFIMSQTKIYRIWDGICQRCLNPKTIKYKNYGGRGIKICDEWLNDSQVFYDWAINNGYKEGLSIERVDNNGNYEPNNCKWATVKEQNNNTRHNVLIAFEGKVQNIEQWAYEKGINHKTLWARVRKYGWSVEKALTKSVNQ